MFYNSYFSWVKFSHPLQNPSKNNISTYIIAIAGFKNMFDGPIMSHYNTFQG